MSKTILLSTVAIAALATSSAFAADMPVKAPPAPPPVWSWAGFYIGAHGGYGWKQNDFAEVVQVSPTVTLGGIDSRGGVVGGQVGYNWQYGSWVVGLEVDGSATRIRGDSDPVVRAFFNIPITDFKSDDVKYLGTARARVGVVPFANWNALLYGTAGLAWERVERTETTITVNPPVTQTVTSTTPRDHFGWVAGVGGELRLGASNWVARVEYLHYDFGTVEPTEVVSTIGAPGNFADKGGRQTIDVVRGGLSYKFDSASSSSPVSAFAAYMPVKAAPPAVWSWAGFYIGAHGGYGWKRNDFADVLSTSPLLTLGGIDSRGGVVGGQVGYNWQYGRWVAGLELDGSATRIRGDSDPLVRTFGGGISVTNVDSDDVQYLGTARARFGLATTFANWDALLYGTAGLAWERVNRIESSINVSVAPPITQFTTETTPRDHFGWVAGVGGELRLGATNWIARAEYLHYDFGTVEPTTVVVVTGGPGSFADKGGRQTIDVVRGGLSYKFDSAPSPLSAYAAYMPVKASPPAVWSWAGFYIGAHGGYGWKRNDFAEVIQTSPLLTLGGIDSRGGVVGGQVGYNWQYGRWVVGLEMDGSATRIRGDSDPLVRDIGGGGTVTDFESDDVQYLGTVRARVGVATPFAGWDTLLYGTAGLAWERVNHIDTNILVVPGTTQFETTTEPKDHFGWVAGAGGELRLGASNWIARAEYLHYDFGTVVDTTAVTITGGPGSFAEKGGRQTIDVVRGGLSYKFGN